MATLWSLGGVDIIVSGDDDKPDTRLSEHVVLDGTESIIHRFGYGSGLRTLTTYILGDTGEYDTLVSGYHNQTPMILFSDQGTEAIYTIWSISRKRLLDTKRTNPSYQVNLELKWNAPGEIIG
jgi:hypothetical protein